ncbi:MAG TPA: DinB family protein [Pyrinomonadaceae bacterium]
MGLSEALLPEFDHEMATTRKTLERVPGEKFDWKPHEKSTTLGALATHLANLPSWVGHTIDKDELDQPPLRIPPAHTRDEVLAAFDRNVAAARAALAGASDERLLGPWTLLQGGNKVLTLPRAAVLRSFVLSHSIHHRAQLGVYLRLNDIPVPAVYGPSADESPFQQ